MSPGLRHEALPYDGTDGFDGFATACGDVVRAGLHADDRMIVLAGADKLAAVTDLLGADAGDVTFVPLDAHGRNPHRVATMLHNFQALTGDRHCLGINETVVAGRGPDVVAEAQLADSLFNDAGFATWPMTLVCLYDRTTLSPDALDSMRRSHSIVRGEAANAAYRPGLAGELWSAPLGAVPAGSAQVAIDDTQLGTMRALVRAEAVRAGVTSERTDDLVLAVNEIVTNSIRYGGGRAVLTLWPVAGGGLVCDVSDAGHLADHMVGRLTPEAGATSGRGMWLAHQLCDLVQVRSAPGATCVRLSVLPPPS